MMCAEYRLLLRLFYSNKAVEKLVLIKPVWDRYCTFIEIQFIVFLRSNFSAYIQLF